MQLSAILIDTWRLLCARRLFWFTLALTALLGVAFLSVGFNERGFFVLFRFDFESQWLREGSAAAQEAYLSAFYWMVKWWTTFLGVILALISCASIFPEFMASGAIDAVLSKPISRGKLFLYKFLSGVLIAASQVVLLAGIVYVAIRWRLGFWHHPVLWTIPLGLALYSYIYAINVFFGIVTRSVLASLLLTLLAWAGIATLQFTTHLLGELAHTTAGSLVISGREESGWRAGAARAHRVARGLMFVLPKTGETTALVHRMVMRSDQEPTQREEDIRREVQRRAQVRQMLNEGAPLDPEALRREVEHDFQVKDEGRQSAAFILGTSFAFEALLLALAGWIFARRDF